jgi:hypothetical protein
MSKTKDAAIKQANATKVVLSGPITGVPDFVTRFACASNAMKERGYKNVFSPADLEPGHIERWYMARCTEQIETATHVFFLSGWEHSAGCRAEWAHAVKLGLALSYQD